MAFINFLLVYHMKSFFLIISLFVFSFSISSQESTYRNPVIQGDFPDPTVIRVGDMYYAAGTSSEFNPPYRLFQSRDLVNWESLGGLFKDIPEWTMGSYWAPELFYKDGTFFVYYTARRKSDQKSYIGVATTKDITQGFTDHGLIVEWTTEAIDAFAIELDGKVYLSWKAYGLDPGRQIELLCSELTPNGLAITGDVWTLIKADDDTWEGGAIEGQCLVKRDDHIYMFYAGAGCCGRNCDYMTGVARAKDIRGPWIKYQNNPILVGDDNWSCSGHGTLVETPNNKHFFLYHAYNSSTNVYTGREAMLDEVVWDEKTGWPYFRYGETPSLQAETPYPGTVQKEITHADVNTIPWIWPVTEAKPQMEIKGESLTLEGNDSPTGMFLGFRVLKGNYLLQATVEPSSTTSGISLYGSADQAVGVSLSGNKIELWLVNKGQRTVIDSKQITSGKDVTLCVQTSFGQYCQFGYKGEDNKYNTLGEYVHVKQLINWNSPAIAGVQVKGTGKAVFKKITVDYGSNSQVWR